MEIKGKVIHVLPVQKGTSEKTGKEWINQEYVLEFTENEKFTRHFLFRVSGDERIKKFDIKEGEEITVSFDVDANESKGRWFAQNNAWKVER